MKQVHETWLSPKIEIRETYNKGKGMLVREPFSRGEKVLEWGGEYTDARGAEIAKGAGKLVLQWDTDLFSVEKRGEDQGYFINHSCDANTWMMDAYTLVAKRSIEIGEEITADYALWECDPDYKSGWMCQCGSPVCRKTISGDDWRRPDVQERYKGHFSPLINKMITLQHESSW